MGLTPPNAAIEEIKAVLAKYDLAGMIVVQSPNESAFLHKIDPSWSCAKFEERPNGTMVRIKAKRAEYPTKEAHQNTVTATTGMIFSFMNQSARTHEQMTSVAEMLGRHFDVSHFEKDNG